MNRIQLNRTHSGVLRVAAMFTILLVASGCLRETGPSYAWYDVVRSDGFVTKGLLEPQSLPITAIDQGPWGRTLDKVVNCQLRGRGFSAQFKTPAIIKLPMYEQGMPAPTVTCISRGQTLTEVINVDLKVISSRKTSITGVTFAFE